MIRTIECDMCHGAMVLEKCLQCGSTDIENTDEKTGCQHEAEDFDEIDCPKCDRTGAIEFEDGEGEDDDGE